MKYLKLYESFSNTPESDLFNIVFNCINDTYPNRKDFLEVILSYNKDNEEKEDNEEKAGMTKQHWINFVLECLSPENKKEIGTYFIKNYITENRNKMFFDFLSRKFQTIDQTIADLIRSNGGTCISAPVQLTIAVNPTPTVAVILNDINTCVGQNVSLDAANPQTSSTYTYTWSNTTGNLTTGASYIINNIQLNQAGMYTVTVVNVGNCSNSVAVDITVSNCDLEIPQLVTPNGDGKNDVFEIKNIQLFPNNKVQIFNRWGNIVYSAEKYQNEWKGTNDKGNGGILPAGTYFVIVEFGDEKTPAYHGYIQLQY